MADQYTVKDVAALTGHTIDAIENYLRRDQLPFEIGHRRPGSTTRFNAEIFAALCIFVAVAVPATPRVALNVLRTWLGGPLVVWSAGTCWVTVDITSVLSALPENLDMKQVRRLVGWIDRPIDIAIALSQPAVQAT